MIARRPLNGTGIEVSAIGLGGMPLSIAGRPEPGQARAVVRAYLEAGGDFIDMANVYCLSNDDLGHNERLIGGVVHEMGLIDRVLLATKGGMTRPGGDWVVDGRPEWLRRSCEQSLRDIGVERIRLYQLHAVDEDVPVEESLGELLRLQEAGKIEHIGVSNVDMPTLQRALRVARVVSVQNRCNVFVKRDFTSGLVSTCAERGIAYIAHSAVGGHRGHVRLREEPTVARVAGRHGVSPYVVVLAWLLAKAPNVLPIPGASRVASVHDSLEAPALVLDAQDVDAIDAIPDA